MTLDSGCVFLHMQFKFRNFITMSQYRAKSLTNVQKYLFVFFAN